MKTASNLLFGGVVLFTIFTFATSDHGHRPSNKYPYLDIRIRPFPWGDGDTPLFGPYEHGHDDHGAHH